MFISYTQYVPSVYTIIRMPMPRQRNFLDAHVMKSFLNVTKTYLIHGFPLVSFHSQSWDGPNRQMI